MSKRTWILFAVICIAIIGGLIYVSRGNKIDVSGIDVWKIQSASALNGEIADHVSGNANAKVVLIEYGDFQCPGCSTASPAIKAVSEKYKDQIAFVFRNYPLYSLHPNALAAATAAEAAGLQGKYWEMHNALYADQNAWNQLSSTDRVDYFVNLASSLGADGAKVRTDMAGENIKKKIDFDVALGKKIGIASTPSIYLNGESISDKRFNGSNLSTNTSDNYVWSDATALENLIIKPALDKAGIKYQE